MPSDAVTGQAEVGRQLSGSSSTWFFGFSTRHITRQLKLVIPGGAVVYYLRVFDELRELLHKDHVGWERILTWSSFSAALSSLLVFIYVMYSPVIMGASPDLASWKRNAALPSIIPILTALLIGGWILLTITVSAFTELGSFQGFIGVSALYALTFGCLGLLPAPRVGNMSSHSDDKKL